MPKPISLDPDKPKKKKKRKKRKIDYTTYLVPPVVPSQQCVHTTKPVEASTCSQCMSVAPSVVKKPQTVDWWAADDEIDPLLEEISLEDFENGETSFTELDPDDPF